MNGSNRSHRKTMKFVVNGKKKKLWKGKFKDVIFSKSRGEIVSIVRELIKNGERNIVAVGGDGTFHEVINGCFQNGKVINENVTIHLFFLGSSGDTLRTLKKPIKSDVIEISWHSEKKYSVNMVNFGIGGVVSSFAYGLPFLKGKLKYELSTFYSFVKFKGDKISLEIDNKKIGSYEILNLAVANGEFTGGGMWMAPGAKMDDGILDVVIIRNMSTSDFLKKLPKLYSGEIYEVKEVIHLQGKQIKIEGVTSFEADGEPSGKSPVQLRVIPSVLNLVPYGM